MTTTKQLPATTHWSHDVVPNDIVILNEISKNIDKHFIGAASHLIEIGHALNQARKMFPGDKEFGQWREERTSVKSARTATAYMAIARKFNTHSLVAKTSMGVLQELTSADISVVEQVENKINGGENITVARVREIKKEAKSDTPQTSADTTPTKPAPKPAPVVTQPEPDMPDGEYELIPLTEDDIRTVLAALTEYGTAGALELIKRLQET